MMTLGSLFDGSGGFPLAGALSGIRPVWAAEVEPYPIAVTRSRFPMMQHLGSVTEVHGDKVQPVDVITFGSPCQDLSVAGKRAGIHEGQRSNLFFEAIRIIKEMRAATNGRYPTFAVWENVPGAFSSHQGEDFRCVLEEFVKIRGGGYTVPRPDKGKWRPAGEILGDGFSVAWRQLDAQYWGVPQRRKRIYLVADFAGGRASKILFEREGLRGHPAPGRATGQGAAADAPGSTGGSRGIECLNPWDAQTIRQYAIDGVFPALGANSGGGQNRAGVCFAQNQRDELRDLGEKTGALAAEQGMHQQNFIALKCLNPWDCQSKRIYQPEGVYPTLPAMDGGGANNQAIMYALDSMSSNSMKSSNPRSGFHEETVAKTLQAGGVAPTCNQGGNVIVEPVYALQGNGIDRADTAGCNGRGWREDVCYTLNTIDRPAICFKAGQGAKARSLGESETVTPTLGSEAGGNSVPAVCYPKVFHTLTALNAGNVESAQQPNCVCYPQVARTLTAGNGTPCIDRGQNVVCYDARGNGDGAHCPTLTGDHENRVTDYTAVAVYRSPKIGEYAADGTASTMAARDFKSPRDLVVEHPPAYGVDCRNAVLDEEKTHTLQAKANGGQSLNCTPSVLTSGKPPRKYIIRRLTPLECCRLQGFPDGWGVPAHKDKLSDEELAFWQEVRDTCSLIAGKPSKKYSAETLTKWYNALHTDSAEYKMWGNGIALPCAAFVLGGVAEALMEGNP